MTRPSDALFALERAFISRVESKGIGEPITVADFGAIISEARLDAEATEHDAYMGDDQ